MLAAGRGSIVNITSEAGLRGNASGNAYTVSKHGVVGLTRSAAVMYGPHGVRQRGRSGRCRDRHPDAGDAVGIGMSRLSAFHRVIPGVAAAEQLAASISFC